MSFDTAESNRKLRALHVKTGDHVLASRIDRWLAADHVHVTAVAEPFEACIELSGQKEPPQIVLVGLDWLADEELTLLGFVRESWPNTLLIAYSSDRGRQVVLHDAMGLVCRDSAELTALLASTPSECFRRVRDGQRSTAPSRTKGTPRQLSPSFNPPPMLPKILDLPISRVESDTDPEPRPDNFAPPAPATTALRPVASHPPADSSELVSREELAALLNTYFR